MTPHLTLGGKVHLANVHDNGSVTNRPWCGAGSRRRKGTPTTAPLTCTKCANRKETTHE